MSFQPKRLDVLCLTKVIKHELQRQEPDIEYLENLLSRLPPDSNHLALESLFHDSSLNDNQFLNYLSLYLDKRTKNFSMRATKCQKTIIAILRMITKLSPNIETIDFTEISFESQIKDEFIHFLKNCKNLKSLRVFFTQDKKTLMPQLLNEEQFSMLDEDVLSRLETIEYIKFGKVCLRAHFNKLINRLPKLTNFTTPKFHLSCLLSGYFRTSKSFNRTFDLTEIYDISTSLQALENYANLFPKATKMTLVVPQRNVVENLWKFSLLSELTLLFYDNKELLKLLSICGNKQYKLRLYYPNQRIPNSIFYDLCSEWMGLYI